jgi:hypothetical protein
LRAHHQTCHPAYLQAFEEGWHCIGKQIQEDWLAKTNCDIERPEPTGRRSEAEGCKPPLIFYSWSEVVLSAFFAKFGEQWRPKAADLFDLVQGAMQKSKYKIFQIPVGDEPEERRFRRLLRNYFVIYLTRKIKAAEETLLLERLEAQFVEPDGLEKMFKDYAPEFTWFDRGNFEEHVAMDDCEDWSESSSIIDGWSYHAEYSSEDLDSCTSDEELDR